MKKVFTSINEIAHIWATQSQDEARNTGNFYFYGKTIYSYGRHFPIAEHVTNKKGKTGILFTTDKYSNTTSKHIWTVQKASNHLFKIYVPSVSNTARENFEWWTKRIYLIAENLLKAKKPEKYITQINSVYKEAEAYAEFFLIKIPKELTKAWKTVQTDKHKEILRKAAEKEKLRKIEQAKKLEISIQEDLLEFRAFKKDYIYYRNEFDYLRFNANTRRVETSQRVEIPEAIAKQFYYQVLETIKNGGCSNCGFKLLNYTVKEINKDFIQVGCHKIKNEEIVLLANCLNW